MIYEFICDLCHIIKGGGFVFEVEAKPFDPPRDPLCPRCQSPLRRIYSAQIDTSGCKDHDFIPETQRVADTVQPFSGEKKGRLFSKRIDERRKFNRENPGKEVRHTHSVPADLYYGKIKETGDKQYWSDPANMKKHESCRVDK